MGKLSEMPNIGKELEKRLQKIGIKTSEQLIQTGSQKVIHQLHAVDPNVCICTFYALEGAIQNCRWHNLDPVTKEDVKHFYSMLKKLK